MYTYTKRELQGLDTIEQSWDGAELKIEDSKIRVWLVQPEHRAFDGDYQIEVFTNGKWNIKNYYFNY